MTFIFEESQLLICTKLNHKNDHLVPVCIDWGIDIARDLLLRVKVVDVALEFICHSNNTPLSKISQRFLWFCWLMNTCHRKPPFSAYMSACPDTLKSWDLRMRDLRKFTWRGITELLAGDSTSASWKAKDGGFWENCGPARNCFCRNLCCERWLTSWLVCISVTSWESLLTKILTIRDVLET